MRTKVCQQTKNGTKFYLFFPSCNFLFDFRFVSATENDKENDSRSAQATQAVIQRRRRPKRRSTGVVHVDMDVSENCVVVVVGVKCSLFHLCSKSRK